MKLDLSARDQAILAGDDGPGAQLAMSVITKMAEMQAAEKLISVTSAHIDSSIYTGDASLQFAEKLAGMGAKVCIPSTLNVSSIDEFGWQAWNVPPDFAQKASRQMRAYRQIGCIPTWSCAPYQIQHRPAQGELIAWSESNAVVFANSVLGARTERFPGFLDICVAITGRAPASGMYLTENRAAQVSVDLGDIPVEMQQNESFFAVLGYWIGKECQEKIPVIWNLSVVPDENQLKALGAAAASSGGIPMFHMVGITPEAPTLEDAFQGQPAQLELKLNGKMLMDAFRQLNTAPNQHLDAVFLGCPHFSLEEFRLLANLISGKKCSPEILFMITTSRTVREEAEREGYLQAAEQFGARISVDTCVLISPILPNNAKSLMTNSAKCAYYAPGQLGKEIHFGNLQNCVESSVKGYAIKENFEQ